MIKAVFESFNPETLISNFFLMEKTQNFTEILPKSMGIAYKLVGRKS